MSVISHSLGTQHAFFKGRLYLCSFLKEFSESVSPHYLLRFITERTRTDNTTAVGGNATLLELGAKEE